MTELMKSKLLIFTIFVSCLLAQTVFAQEAKFDVLSLNMRLNPVRGQPEWRWTPVMAFDIWGPLSASSEITVEYTLPTGKSFVKTKCWTEQTEAGERMRVSDCGRDLERETATNLTGVFGFQIKQTDELNGINKVLYTGKFTVSKYLYNPANTAANARNFYYYVEYDWRLPFAYLGIQTREYSKTLLCSVWLKSDTTSPDVKAYLMFNGKPVAEAAQSGSVQYDLEDNDAQEFTRMDFEFNALFEKPGSPRDNVWKLYENPGDYEIKVLRHSQLARAMKFSIEKGGKFVDNGIARENKIWGQGILVAAQIVGDSDGKINRLAFKEGIWGNPLNGFTPQ